MTIDGRGNIYVNSIGFDFAEMSDRVSDRSKPPTGVIGLITPDGTAREVADGIAFPNGMVVTPDNDTLIVSESFTGTPSRSTSPMTVVSQAAVLGLRASVPTASAWTPSALSGRRHTTTSVYASPKAATSSTGSNSIAPASPPCLAAMTAAPCS